MKPTSYIELSQSAVKNNLTFIRKMLGDTQLSAVVKGNAYGHGIKAFCQMLYQNDVKHFSVFSANEAHEVLACTPKDVTVLIMGFIENEQIEWAVKHQVEFFVFEMDRLNRTLEVSKKTGIQAKVHIEIETGMNRTGFPIASLDGLFNYIEENKNYLLVKGICSHLSGAESISNYKRIQDQIKIFKKVQKKVQKLQWPETQFHLACSAAVLQYPNTRFDLARIGILHYGFFPSNEVLVQYLTKNKIHTNPLQRVISWKTKVMDVKEVNTGEFVGYGTSFFTNKPTSIAVLPVGYAHGFSRSLSNQGKVLIRGQRFDVIGVVNMNMTLVDITSHTSIRKGDEVVLIGHQDEQEITVSSFSNLSDMVNYELLTRLPANITRKIVD